MKRYYIEDLNHVPPFNQPASELTIGTVPLKIHQENLFAEFAQSHGQALELGAVFQDSSQLIGVKDEAIVYRDNLWFDKEFLNYFLKRAKASKTACRAAFRADDPAFRTYTLPLAHDLESSRNEAGDEIYLLDLWYFPNGFSRHVTPIVVPSDAREIGFFSVPGYMTMEQGNLTHYAAMRAIVSIESWLHVYFATVIYGTFARSGRVVRKIDESFFQNVKMLWRAVMEQRQFTRSSEVVDIGTGCSIDPTAIIRGPVKIGNNVSIGAGAVIDNCTLGNDVNIDAGCMLYQSTVGNGSFLPFRAALYLTAVMEDVIIAQNTCLQMCVVGRNTFVGAGSTFTDFNMFGNFPIRAANRYGELEDVGQAVLGGAVGHNCRIGAGMVIMPGRMIESDVVLVASPSRRVISRNVTYEESDHHQYGSQLHKRFFPQVNERVAEDSWDEAW